MHAVLWRIAEYAAIKLINRAIQNEKKPIDTRTSDSLLDRVRQRIADREAERKQDSANGS